ncbi:MAG TPA: cryptochrome/photolyase family protein, partial [Pseudomonas sp.]|nr:cryptochrome/photolyase family protein [Pseudomonas sp.]
YWHFLIRHRPQLSANPRLALVYRSLDQMSADRRDAVWQRGQVLLARLDAAQPI